MSILTPMKETNIKNIIVGTDLNAASYNSSILLYNKRMGQNRREVVDTLWNPLKYEGPTNIVTVKDNNDKVITIPNLQGKFIKGTVKDKTLPM